MKRTYEVASATDKRAMAEFMKREGQFLLPMVELVERTELAIDEVIQVMGRATIEAVLEMSAEGVAGPKQSGKAREEGSTVWYGRQNGLVYLSDRKIRIERPRLRERNGGQGGEVEVPAYAAMRRPGDIRPRTSVQMLYPAGVMCSPSLTKSCGIGSPSGPNIGVAISA